MTLVGDLSLAVLIALGRVAMAAPTTSAPSIPIRIDFAAPPGCSSAAALYSAIFARMDRARRVAAGEEGVRLRVRLARTGLRVHGELSIPGQRGATDTRKVDGSSCDEVVDVLSLTVALALDPSARPMKRPAQPSAAAPNPSRARTPAPAPIPTPASSTAPSVSAIPSPPTATGAATATATGAASARTTVSSALPSSPPLVAEPAAVAPAPSVGSSTPTVQEPAPPPEPTSTSTSKSKSMTAPTAIASTPASLSSPAGAAAAAPPRSFEFGLGARAMFANVVSPYVSLGGALTGTLMTDLGSGPPASVGIALLYLPTDFLQPQNDIVVRWTAAALTVCPPWGVRGRLQVQACALAMAGWLAVTDRVISNPSDVGRSWWSLGGVIRGSVAIGRGFALELEAGLSAPLVKRRFVVDPVRTTAGETPVISAIAGLGVSHRL